MVMIGGRAPRGAPNVTGRPDRGDPRDGFATVMGDVGFRENSRRSTMSNGHDEDVANDRRA